MRQSVIAFVRTIFLILLFVTAGEQALAQQKDTTRVVTTLGGPIGSLPPTPSGEPFFDIINPEKEGLRPKALYSSEDRIYVGVNYNKFSRNWKLDSSGARHKFYTHYSIEQKAFSLGYLGIYNRIAGDWNMLVDANYDWVRWLNFSGLGNESLPQTENNDYYRVRSREALVAVGFQHRLGRQSNFILTPFFQHVKLLRDEGRFITTQTANDPKLNNYKPNNFGGIRADLILQKLDDLLIPTKGAIFSTNVSYLKNIGNSNAVTNYRAYTRFYVPFLNHFVLSVENGAAALAGQPEFYQLNAIGGSNLRGFRRERFWGETIYHNNNELQYLFNVTGSQVEGTFGVLAFFDQGRVWKRGEQSDRWHYGYGGGIILAPFRMVYLSVQYGISNERKGFHIDFRRAL